jgi:hypothetical protein
MWILTDYPVAMIVLFGSTLRYYRANNLVPPDSRSAIRPQTHRHHLCGGLLKAIAITSTIWKYPNGCQLRSVPRLVQNLVAVVSPLVLDWDPCDSVGVEFV